MPGRLDLIHYLAKIVARWRLHRRELPQSLEPFEPELLAEGQHIPVILICGRRSSKRASDAHGCFLGGADCLLEWIALDILNQSPVERYEGQYPALCPGLGHGVVHFPVLVAHCRGRRAREVVEHLSR